MKYIFIALTLLANYYVFTYGIFLWKKEKFSAVGVWLITAAAWVAIFNI